MSAKTSQLRVFLIDDEALALKRLARLLQATGRVEIAGSATDPEAALDFLSRENVDALFLDIEMPGLNGFEMLARLKSQPLVIFTTAYDQYALRAFEVNSIDYLLKPIEAEQLDRALAKLERMRATGAPPELRAALEQLAHAVQHAQLRVSRPHSFAHRRPRAVHRTAFGHALHRQRQTDFRSHG